MDSKLNETLNELEDRAETVREVMGKCIEFAELLREKDTNASYEIEAAKVVIASIEIALLALQTGMKNAIKLSIEAALAEKRK